MNIDQYLANPSVVGQRCDSQTKTFTIVLRGQLNTSDLNYLISQNMASSGPAAPVVALFLARETKSVKQLKVRDNVVSKTTSTSSDDKMADVTENSVSSERVSSSMQATSMAEAESLVQMTLIGLCHGRVILRLLLIDH